MTDIQALFPVQLPRAKAKGEKDDDYNARVAQNENNINQNFNILYKAIMELKGDA